MLHDDLHSSIYAKMSLEPATYITVTTTGTTIDTKGYSALDVLFILGDSGDTLSAALSWTWSLTESDDDSTYTAVALADTIGVTTLAGCIANAETEDSTIYRIGYKGSKRYIRPVMTATGTGHSTGIYCTMIGILAHPHTAPTTEQAQP